MQPASANTSTVKLAVRRWWTIMPIVFITYSLAYLDRANFGFASAAGINHDLGISHGLASLIGALAIQVIGDSEGLPTRAELDKLEQAPATTTVAS